MTLTLSKNIASVGTLDVEVVPPYYSGAIPMTLLFEGLADLKAAGCLGMHFQTRFQPLRAIPELTQRSQQPYSCFDKAEDNGRNLFEFDLYIDGDGLDEDDTNDVQLLKTATDDPLEWTVECLFSYEASRYVLSVGLPLRVSSPAQGVGDGVITGMRFVFLNSQDFLRGVSLDTEIDQSGSAKKYLIWIHGFIRHSLDTILIRDVLNYSMPHANTQVRTRTEHGVAGVH